MPLNQLDGDCGQPEVGGRGHSATFSCNNNDLALSSQNLLIHDTVPPVDPQDLSEACLMEYIQFFTYPYSLVHVTLDTTIEL